MGNLLGKGYSLFVGNNREGNVMRNIVNIWVVVLSILLALTIAELVHVRLEMKKLDKDIASLRELIVIQKMLEQKSMGKYHL